jgi:phage tail sheath protein FI
MPSALTYPGVYVEEIPSGVRTITGVATSVTAFVGKAYRGPVNQAITINNFGDFEKLFGGLRLGFTMGYAVRDFFLNGGAQAVIVRLYHADPGSPNANPVVPPGGIMASLTVGGLTLTAANAGKWGVGLRASIDRNNLPAGDAFNLTVTDTGTGVSEKYLNLTATDSARRIDNVLLGESALVRCALPNPAPAVTAGTDALSTAEAAVTTAKKTLADKQNAGAPPADITAAQAAVTTVQTALNTALTAALGAVSDGLALSVLDFLPANGETNKQGLFALEQTDIFNLLCIPPYAGAGDGVDIDTNLIAAAAAYCEKRRAMLLLDAPSSWTTKDLAKAGVGDIGTNSRNAALYFPRLRQQNPLHDNQTETFAACGAVAGVFARTDTQRGIWKAPAGLDASLVGVPALQVPLTDAENGELNPIAINCLRAMPAAGRVVWGARTLRGADQLADEYKYVPVRRTALFIEESLFRGLKWVVFEPNDEPLWAQIRLNVGAFLQNMFRQGAFQGSSPKDAYFVKCDKETTTQNDINLGIVNVVVGFAPLKPAEFVVIKLQQIAGQIAV